MGWQDKVAGMCSPCSGIPAPCEASGRLGRHLPSVGGGPASAARRMGRAWARMGHRTSSAFIALITFIAFMLIHTTRTKLQKGRQYKKQLVLVVGVVLHK
jgi:hypothetical protein